MLENTGVALDIIGPNEKHLILEEFFDKPRLKKKAGDSSNPMETVRKGATAFQTLHRMWREELPGMPTLPLPGQLVGQYQIVLGEIANLYVVRIDSLPLPKQDTPSPEVGNYRWLTLEEIPGVQLRPGAKEMIRDSAAGLTGIFREFCEDYGR